MRLLTKSRYKLGLECPNKLYFAGKPQYANNRDEDSFLESLAQGGYQVEELAKLHYPGGVEVKGNSYKEQWKHTQELLKRDNVVIFQASFLYQDLFARVDILEKQGNVINVIEVKAKSYDPGDEYIFLGKKGGINSKWRLYLFDLAFQDHLVRHCVVDHQINSFFLMADKSKVASINGLNQLFRVKRSGDNRIIVDTKAKSLDEVGESVLSTVDVSDIITNIRNDTHQYAKGRKFESTLAVLSSWYRDDSYAQWPTSFRACRDCEFQTDELHNNQELSGQRYCFETLLEWKDEESNKPTTLEMWNFRRGPRLWKSGTHHMDQISKEDLDLKDIDRTTKLTTAERHWLQATKTVEDDKEIFVLKDLLRDEMNKWKYPLHFIDFETSSVALPFHKGMHPYEQVAFQFSHHIYHENGSIEHKTEYIEVAAGVFPNFEFVRALSSALSADEGTIFRFADHENTVLNAIHTQLSDSSADDADELMAFIERITKATKKNPQQWEGDRNMVDLCDIIKDYYYNPLTKGSNSMKKVLIAVLSSDDELRAKYSKVIGDINLTSLNFPDDHRWVQTNGNQVKDPYSILPTLISGWTDEQIEKSLSEIDDIRDGGAALVAYAKLQFTDMEDWERSELEDALKKYCELDTLGMVMVYEHLRNLIES